ncbi:CTLH/CRA C-terminal to lish motif domain-containing protein [Xylariaceae sp. FL0804]|nr:CTLH/CRA C-terminal to lish motif domain-containing protein [Xylariaceae sp. FL0804]
MGDHANLKLDHENHLLLDQPLLRLPFELLRKNLRSAHFDVEKDGRFVREALKTVATDSVNGRASRDDVLRQLDAMAARVRGVRRKLAAAAAEEERLQRQEAARVAHLADLYQLHSVDDVKYDGWSRTRLDRLLVDYMLRHGYGESARMLARERGIELLSDLATFEHMSRIRRSLLNGSVNEALQWCTAGDTKKELRKMDSNLEFMLRFQQYIEIVRNRSKAGAGAGATKGQHGAGEALTHARKWLFPYREAYPREVLQACGMLAVPPGAAPRLPAYADLYSPVRWQALADLFTKTHNELLALPPVPLLHIALSMGLSALKTPACHSSVSHNPAVSAAAAAAASASAAAAAASSSSTATTTTTTTSSSLALAASVCPICSTELNELARGVPYAFHSGSHVEPDLLMLPNGRAYGRARLDEYARKSGLAEGQVRDLRTGEVFDAEGLKKVFIT